VLGVRLLLHAISLASAAEDSGGAGGGEEEAARQCDHREGGEQEGGQQEGGEQEAARQSGSSIAADMAGGWVIWTVDNRSLLLSAQAMVCSVSICAFVRVKQVNGVPGVCRCCCNP
jgi:hypothetical protein